MTFDINKFGNWASTMNRKAPTSYMYATTDTLAVVVASAYFNTIIARLKVGSLIYVTASDQVAILTVTSVTTNVTTEVLVNKSASSHIIASGFHTTVGTAAFEDITVTDVLATDVAIVVIKTQGAGARILLSMAAGVDKITITFDADPSTDHVVSYLVVRPL